MAAKKNSPDLVTIPEAAKFLRTTRQAIGRAIKRGRIKVVRDGHVNLVFLSSLKDYKKMRHAGRQPRKKKSSLEQRPEELTSDEVWLLKLISTGEPKTPSKVDTAVKTIRGFQDLRAMLRSLRNRGFIYYSDWNDMVIALPKAYQYLATLRDQL